MDQFIGEIRLFAFPRIPQGWALCDGSLIPINGNEALYNLLGTTYGGGGQTTFALPDLRGRVPISAGTGNGLSPRPLGQILGEPVHTLTMMEMAVHSHPLVASSGSGTSATPATNAELATASDAATKLYAPAANAAPYSVMAPCVSNAGQSLPHNNTMPTLVANYCIALYGIYPTQN